MSSAEYPVTDLRKQSSGGRLRRPGQLAKAAQLTPRPPHSHRFATATEGRQNVSEQQDSGRKWIDEAEEALDRTGEALRAAWEGSREARTSALAAAKEAASRLAEAIDRGAAVARETWDSNKEREGPAPGEE